MAWWGWGGTAQHSPAQEPMVTRTSFVLGFVAICLVWSGHQSSLCCKPTKHTITIGLFNCNFFLQNNIVANFVVI
jgi:hypothetical protein